MGRKYKNIFNPFTGKMDKVCDPEDHSTEDGDYLKVDGSNLESDTPIVVPQILPTWHLSGPNGGTSTVTNLTLEYGDSVTLKVKYKWTAAAGRANPTTVIGGTFTALTTSGVLSNEVIYGDISENKTVQVALQCPKKGFYVENNMLVAAAGNQTSSYATCKVTFAHRIYYGVGTAWSTSGIASILSNVRGRTITGITTASDEYYYIAIPTALGALTDILLNGAVPALGAFTRTTISLPNGNNEMTPYYLYTLNNIGALTGSNTLKLT